MCLSIFQRFNSTKIVKFKSHMLPKHPDHFICKDYSSHHNFSYHCYHYLFFIHSSICDHKPQESETYTIVSFLMLFIFISQSGSGTSNGDNFLVEQTNKKNTDDIFKPVAERSSKNNSSLISPRDVSSISTASDVDNDDFFDDPTPSDNGLYLGK